MKGKASHKVSVLQYIEKCGNRGANVEHFTVFLYPVLIAYYVFLWENNCYCITVDGQRVPDAHRWLICQKVLVSRNLSQKVIPSNV